MVGLIIVMLLAYLYMKFVFKDSSGISQQTRKAMSEQGIKANPQGMVQSAQDTVNQLNKKIASDQHEYDNTR